MKNFKALALTALTAASAIIPTAVEARNVDDGHMTLARAILSTGIELKVNPRSCFEQTRAMGWYWAAKNEMVVCQQNAYNLEEIDWTAEDFDTLRHEAQHLIQDCMDGERDGELHAVYQQPLALGKQVLGSSDMQNIANAYSEQSEHIQVMEIEAFAVARLNDPLEQANDIRRYCF